MAGSIPSLRIVRSFGLIIMIIIRLFVTFSERGLLIVFVLGFCDIDFGLLSRQQVRGDVGQAELISEGHLSFARFSSRFYVSLVCSRETPSQSVA